MEREFRQVKIDLLMMSNWFCKIFRHDWDHHELEPHKDEYCGYQKICSRCDEIGDRVRPPGFEENTTELEWA